MGRNAGGAGTLRKMALRIDALSDAGAARLGNAPDGSSDVRASCRGGPFGAVGADAEPVAPPLPMRVFIG